MADFPPADDEVRYRVLTTAQVMEQYRLVSLLAATLVPAFVALDWFTQRPHFGKLVLIRLVTSVILLLAYWGSRRNIYFARSPYVSGVLVTAVTSAGVAAMCLELGGSTSSYYAGVNL